MLLGARFAVDGTILRRLERKFFDLLAALRTRQPHVLHIEHLTLISHLCHLPFVKEVGKLRMAIAQPRRIPTLSNGPMQRALGTRYRFWCAITNTLENLKVLDS